MHSHDLTDDWSLAILLTASTHFGAR